MLLLIIVAMLGGLGISLMILIITGVPLFNALMDCGLGALIVGGLVYTLRHRITK